MLMCEKNNYINDIYTKYNKQKIFLLGLPREYRYKENVSMLENDTMVSAYNYKSFVFLREKSVGDPAVDNINTVNIPTWVSHELKVSDTNVKVEES